MSCPYRRIIIRPYMMSVMIGEYNNSDPVLGEVGWNRLGDSRLPQGGVSLLIEVQETEAPDGGTGGVPQLFLFPPRLGDKGG